MSIVCGNVQSSHRATVVMVLWVYNSFLNVTFYYMYHNFPPMFVSHIIINYCQDSYCPLFKHFCSYLWIYKVT